MRQVQRLWNVSMKIRSSPRSRRVAPYALDAAKAAGVRRVVLVSSILTDGRTMGATDSPGFKITNAFGGTAACLQFCHATRTLRRPRHILDRMSASLSRYSHIASSTSYTRQNVCKSVTLLAHCVVHVIYSTECLQFCHATRTLRRPRHVLDRMSASLSRYSHIASSTSYTRQNVCKSVTLLAHASSTSYTRQNVCKSVALFVHALSTSYTRIPFPYLLVPSFSCNE
jgi:hypothetical protein